MTLARCRRGTAALPPASGLTSALLTLLELLLGAELVGVPALPLPAVHGAGVEARVAPPADHLVAVVLPGEHREGRLDDAAAEPEHKVQRGLLLDVVVAERAAVLELLPGEDEPLLVRRDALLVLDLGLDVVDGVGGLHVERDRLPGERLHEDLHGVAFRTLQGAVGAGGASGGVREAKPS